MKARTCPSCGRTWSDRTAVWCAGCGSTLRSPRPSVRAAGEDAGATEHGDGDPIRSAPHRRRRPMVWSLTAVTASTVAFLLAALFTDTTTWDWPTAGPDTEVSAGPETGRPPGPTGRSEIGQPTAPGGGTVELSAPVPRPDVASGWSPGTEPGAAAVVPAGTAFPPNEPTCDTDGCALWRSTVLDQRPLLVNGELAIHLGLELLIAVDIDTGRWRWSRGHSDPRGVSPAAALTASHLDDRTLAIAYGHRVRIHSAQTGRVLGELDLAPVRVTDIRRHEGQLVATGRIRDSDEPRTRLLGLDDDGRVRYDLEVTRPVRQQRSTGNATAPLLAIDDDHLVRYDATTGTERWREALDGRQVDGTTLIDRETGEVTMLGVSDGRELLRLARPGAVAAGVRDGVLVVTFAEGIELHDRGGTALGEVAVAPERTVVATTSRQVMVVTLPAVGASDPQPQVRIGRRVGGSGGLFPLPSIAATTTVPLPPGEEPARVGAMRRADGVLVGGPETDWAWVVDPRDATAERLEFPLLPGSEIGHGDGLTIIRNGQQLTIMGAGGSFDVRGATQMASLDPLIVHGGKGTLRLDRALVDGGSDRG